jgi:hypothetical protein
VTVDGKDHRGPVLQNIGEYYIPLGIALCPTCDANGTDEKRMQNVTRKYLKYEALGRHRQKM